MIPFDVVTNHVKKLFELQQADLKIALDVLRFAAPHVRQV
jgi:hypothetical protein